MNSTTNFLLPIKFFTYRKSLWTEAPAKYMSYYVTLLEDVSSGGLSVQNTTTTENLDQQTSQKTKCQPASSVRVSCVKHGAY